MFTTNLILFIISMSPEKKLGLLSVDTLISFTPIYSNRGNETRQIICVPFSMSLLGLCRYI